MRTIPLLGTVVIGLGLLGAPGLMAQNEKADGAAMTVTGCLAQGDHANEYSIKSANGKVYGLFASGGVNMKAHVGHKVTITGSPMKESAGEKENAKNAKADEESEHLRVTNLTMVSTTCP